MAWLIIKNECDNDYVSPGLLAIEMTEKFRKHLREIDYEHWSDRVKFVAHDISDFEPMYLDDVMDKEVDNWRFLSDFLLNDVSEDWIIVSDLPSGLPLLEDGIVNAMQVDCDGGVTFKGYINGYQGDELYTLAIQIDDLLAKEAVVVDWDEYLKGDGDGKD